MKISKSVLKGVAFGVALGGVTIASVPAVAKQLTETIEVTYNNIKVYVDNKHVLLSDANGGTVEPFIYNGSTYLPVRAVGEAMGEQVSWDGQQQIVYIGEKPGDVTYMMDVCPPYSTTYLDSYFVSDGKTFKSGGKEFSNGLLCSYTEYSFSDYVYRKNKTQALFNLDGKYSSLSIEVGPKYATWDDCEVIFYVDGEIVQKATIKKDDLSKKYTIPLNGGLQLRIDSSNANIGYGDLIVR